MKNILLSVLFIGLKTLVFAQNKVSNNVLLGEASLGELSGNIIESSGKPLAFANVLLLNAKDSALVKGTVSKENGDFNFEKTRYGQYLVVASMVGYTKVYTPPFVVSAENHQIKLAKMVAEPSANQLKEVAVAAKKPLFEQQIDRMVINVQNSITAAGSTALEVLERSPGVTVNRQGNSLIMSGKSGVMVMFNGKLTRLPMDAVIQMLDGMSANNIEKIELITAPSAKYDAEGDAGLINIVMKKNTNFGTNGSLSATLGYGWYARPATSLTLNYRNKKINVYSEYSYNNNHVWSRWNMNREVPQATGLTLTELVTTRFTTFPQHNAKIGFDYSLKNNTTINGLVAGFDTKSYLDAPNYSMEYQGGNLLRKSNLRTYETNHWQNLMLNLNVRHIFKNKQEWSMDVDKLWYNNSNPSTYFNEIKELKSGSTEQQQFRISKECPVQLWVIKSDFLTKMGKKGKFDAGLKAALTDLNNDVKLERLLQNNWQIDPTFTQRFVLAEDIFAGYANFNTSLSVKTSLQSGIRYEYTKTDLDTPEGEKLLRRRYGNFFPSIFISHKLSKTQAFNLSYNKRITRASYKDFAPFTLYFDQNTLVTGNPKLLPTISDALQGSYILKDTYIFSLKYSNDKNTISRYQPHVNTETNQLSYYAENLAGIQTIALSSSIPIKLTKWWQSQNNLTGYWQQMNTIYQDKPVSLSVWNMQFNTSQTFSLPRKFTAEITYFYNTPTLFGITHSLAKSELTVGIQKQLPKDKGILRLNISDVFWTNIGRWDTNIPSINVLQSIVFTNEPRVVRFTYSRNFGNKNVKATKKRATGSEEERQRL